MEYSVFMTFLNNTVWRTDPEISRCNCFASRSAEFTPDPAELDVFEKCAVLNHFRAPAFVANCGILRGEEAKDNCMRSVTNMQEGERFLQHLAKFGVLFFTMGTGWMALQEKFPAYSFLTRGDCVFFAVAYALAFGSGYILGRAIDEDVERQTGKPLHEHMAEGLYNLVGDKLLID